MKRAILTATISALLLPTALAQQPPIQALDALLHQAVEREAVATVEVMQLRAQITALTAERDALTKERDALKSKPSATEPPK
jgi:hypothetical protein